MEEILIPIIVGVAALVIGILVGFLIRKKIGEAKIGSAEAEAARILEEGAKGAAAKKKEALVEDTEQGRFARLRRLNALRLAMKRAAHKEDFEEAARLRDEIRAGKQRDLPLLTEDQKNVRYHDQDREQTEGRSH